MAIRVVEAVSPEPREQTDADSLPFGRGFTDEQVERGAVASYAFEGEERPWVEAPPSVRDHYRGNVVAILAAIENTGADRAVSPEPREGPEYATHEAERCRFESPEARCVLLLGHVGQHVFGGAEPREGRADPRLKVTLYRNSAVKATKETRLTRGGSGYVVATWPEGGTVFQARADFAAGDRARTPAPSVASVLRRTASRLRDPEHRWSVDPAVTLERLAEKLEKEDR